ncbi:hypothetical protein FQA47_025329 [Oryzias melastigma]|uniref:Uncharacterized protein n=1 Tax=Oryzias melastigma TaxID=30732 RepID=A0A834FRH0_ORYME|nr:hypothetical protein FQA47_025329 [Oryzias melastigma]
MALMPDAHLKDNGGGMECKRCSAAFQGYHGDQKQSRKSGLDTRPSPLRYLSVDSELLLSGRYCVLAPSIIHERRCEESKGGAESALSDTPAVKIKHRLHSEPL